MKKIFFIFHILFSAFVVAQEFDYNQIGDIHNGALNAVLSNPTKQNLEDSYGVILDYTKKRTGDTIALSYIDVKKNYDTYRNMSPNDAIAKLLSEGKIDAQQVDYFNQIQNVLKKEDDATFLQDIQVIETNASKNLSKEKQPIILTFCSVARHSFTFWTNVSNETKPIYKGGVNANHANLDPEGCCSKCVKKHKWALIWSDGFGAAMGVLVCVATGFNPVTCITSIVGFAAVLSLEAMTIKCPCC